MNPTQAASPLKTPDLVMQLIKAYQEAVLSKDVDSLMRLYDPGVRIFDAWGVWSYDGAPAWQLAVANWLTSLGSERVQVSFDSVQSIESSELIIVSAFVSYVSIALHDEPMRAMQNRISWCLRRTSDTPHGCMIVHEHTSAPIRFEDSKAILKM